jgi:hypothetical protein
VANFGEIGDIDEIRVTAVPRGSCVRLDVEVIKIAPTCV